jgi:hypothetical protein
VRRRAVCNRLTTLRANAGMPDCPAFCQSGTKMEINADAGTSLVPGIRGSILNAQVLDSDAGRRSADAGGIVIDADAHL